MFTGIVSERGRVVGFTDGRLEIEAPATASDAAIGDSVSVSGACLTVVSVDEARANECGRERRAALEQERLHALPGQRAELVVEHTATQLELGFVG